MKKEYTKDIEDDKTRQESFFTAAERAEIVYFMISTVQLNEEDVEFVADIGVKKPKRFLKKELPMIKILEGEGGGIEATLAYPYTKVKHNIFHSTMWTFATLNKLPINNMRDYYGEEVTYYFAWMQFYCSWLLVPAVVGLGVYFLRHQGITVDNNPVVPFFSLFVALWAVTFTSFWRQKANSLAWKFGTYNLEDTEEVRPEFRGIPGKERVSPVTGKKEPVYPYYRRYAKCLVSATATGALLLVAVAVMFCSLNLQGYIKPEHFGWIEELQEWSAPGAILDKNSAYMSYIPVCLHAIVIALMNSNYRKLAEKLTEWENWRTDREFEFALVVKRLCFEFCDCFLPLFYIAFYTLDIMALRSELVSLFMFDQIRRTMLEAVIPFFVYRGRRNLEKVAAKKEGLTGETPEVIRLLSKEEYESFDDYLEMVMQFGYVTLFASAMPLAALCALVSNLVELRSDIFKMTWVMQRPQPRRVKDLGPWQGVMVGFAVLSIVTNSMLFGFSSHQMMVWFPEFFNEMGTRLKAGEARYAVAFVFGVEHLVMIMALLIRWLVPPVAEKMQYEIMAERYENTQLFLNERMGKKKTQ
eukprot:TRINITY_DN67131_c4_g1_i1.p1 TRINITY_DN67131_c4_g1~~TRINITY_DN67131_c4_g1_i1.p1  ORF type:complete len:663 (-),score=77.58 TRINITY_DN67131_c4_g1_i1:95-1846(-)